MADGKSRDVYIGFQLRIRAAIG